MKKEKDYSERARKLMAGSIPWTESMTWKEFGKRNNYACLCSDSTQKVFNEFESFLCAPNGLDKLPRIKPSEIRRNGLKLGDMRLSMLRVPHRTDTKRSWFMLPPTELDAYELLPMAVINRGREVGCVYWDGDVHIPHLASIYHTCWMSYSFSEVMSQRSGIKAAKGRVFIGGLGLGWLAKRVAEKPEVRSVVVAETAKELGKFVGKALKHRFAERVNVVLEDAFAHVEGNMDAYDTVLMDVWPGYGEGNEDRRWRNLRSKLKAAGIKTWEWT